jgi:small GTP-binding protein
MEKLSSKVIVLGDGAVGKTSIVHRYVTEKFQKRYTATIGVDILNKSVKITKEVTDYEVNLNLWDIGGQDSFKLVRGKFYKQAIAALLIFDITNRKSFDNLKEWIKETYDNVEQEIPFIMIGNKVDLVDNRAISNEEVQKRAKELGISLVIETSAVTGEGIDQAFNYLAHTIIDYHVKKINNK